MTTSIIPRRTARANPPPIDIRAALQRCARLIYDDPPRPRSRVLDELPALAASIRRPCAVCGCPVDSHGSVTIDRATVRVVATCSVCTA